MHLKVATIAVIVGVISGCGGQREYMERNPGKSAVLIPLAPILQTFPSYDHTYDNKKCIAEVDYTWADSSYRRNQERDYLEDLFYKEKELFTDAELNKYNWVSLNIYNKTFFHGTTQSPFIRSPKNLKVVEGDYVSFINWNYSFDKPISYIGNNSGLVTEVVCVKSDKSCKKLHPKGCTELDGSPLIKGRRPDE